VVLGKLISHFLAVSSGNGLTGVLVLDDFFRITNFGLSDTLN
jgi:hypothetical protein